MGPSFSKDSESFRGSMSEGVSTRVPGLPSLHLPPFSLSPSLLLHHLACLQLGILTPTTSLWSLTSPKDRRRNSDLR